MWLCTDLLFIPFTLIPLHGNEGIQSRVMKTMKRLWLILLSFRITLFHCMGLHPQCVKTESPMKCIYRVSRNRVTNQKLILLITDWLRDTRQICLIEFYSRLSYSANKNWASVVSNLYSD